MGRVSFEGWRRDNLSHIEIEGCIINIRTKLHDLKSREVTSIEILADEMNNWKLFGTVNNRVIKLKSKR